MTEAQEKKPYHEIVAERLIEQLKAGTAPWQRSWAPGEGEPTPTLPMNPVTGNRYKGVNTVMLLAQGYDDPRWMTYRQAQSIGAQVRKGEKSTAIMHWRFDEERVKRDEKGQVVRDADGNAEKIRVPLERPRPTFSAVFNAEQIDGLPELRPKVAEPWQAIERAEKILENSGAKIRNIYNANPAYNSMVDVIRMPERQQYKSADLYYSDALHELGHWTGHHTRLNRELGNPFGSEKYAREELRAEIASMIIGQEIGLGHDPRNHVAYVGSWIKALEEDPMEIVRAAADAEKIQNYVLSLENTPEVERQKQRETSAITAATSSTSDQDTSLLAQDNEQRVRRDEHSTDQDIATAQAATQSAERADAAVQQTTERQSMSMQALKEADEQPRQYLAVPYSERIEAKAAGARWDAHAKSWYVGPNANLEALDRWRVEPDKPRQAPAHDPRAEFADVMRTMGLKTDAQHPIMNGKPHRVAVEGGKRGAVDGWYVGHLDGRPAGRIINYKTGEDRKWKSNGTRLSDEDRAHLLAAAATKLVQRATEHERKQEAVAQRLEQQTHTMQPVVEPTPYIERKRIGLHAGALTDQKGKTTFLPAYDANGKLWSMQYINEDGSKRFAKDSRKEGTFHAVGGLRALDSAPVILIAEGYATAAQLAQARGHATVAAFDSGNLEAVAKALRTKWPEKPLVIAGDDDRHLILTDNKNPGRQKGEAAARAVDGVAVFPIFPIETAYPSTLTPITPNSYRTHRQAKERLDDADAGASLSKVEAEKLRAVLLSDDQLQALNTLKTNTDFNDLARTSGEQAVKRQIEGAVIQAEKLTMERGSGKEVAQEKKLEIEAPKRRLARSM